MQEQSDAPTPFDQIAPEDSALADSARGDTAPAIAIAPTAVAVAPLAETLAPVAHVPVEESGAEESAEQAPPLNEETFDDGADEPLSPGGGWTIPMICMGIAMIACCVLIPAAEENRRLVFEREHLRADLEQISRQTEVNDEFLKRVADDPSLSERLAQRQMKMVRQGTSILELRGESTSTRDMSPYELTTLAPPPETPPYHPRGGFLGTLVSNPRSQLYVMGGGMLFVAAGLVLGSTPTRK